MDASGVWSNTWPEKSETERIGTVELVENETVPSSGECGKSRREKARVRGGARIRAVEDEIAWKRARVKPISHTTVFSSSR